MWLTPRHSTSTRRETSTKKTFTTFGYSLVDRHPLRLQRQPRHRLQQQHQQDTHAHSNTTAYSYPNAATTLHYPGQRPRRGVFRHREGVRLRGRGRRRVAISANIVIGRTRSGMCRRWCLLNRPVPPYEKNGASSWSPGTWDLSARGAPPPAPTSTYQSCYQAFADNSRQSFRSWIKKARANGPSAPRESRRFRFDINLQPFNISHEEKTISHPPFGLLVSVCSCYSRILALRHKHWRPSASCRSTSRSKNTTCLPRLLGK